VFSSFTRTDVPETVGLTNIRTVLLLKSGIVWRALCDTVHAENHRACVCANAAAGASSTLHRIANTAKTLAQ
jgi:hypothetical protein